MTIVRCGDSPARICSIEPARRILPCSMITAPLQISASSVRMWELMRMALPRSASTRSNSRSSTRARGSSPAAGSSSTSTGGSWTSARARLTRCFMPFDSARRNLSRMPFRLVNCSTESTTASRFGAAQVVRPGEKVEVFVDRHVAVRGQGVGHEADVAAGLLRIVDQRHAVDVRVAVGRIVERGQDAHRRGLAGAVGTDEAEDVAGGELERDVVDRLGLAEVPLQVDDSNVHCLIPSRCRRRLPRCLPTRTPARGDSTNGDLSRKAM